MSKIFTLVNGLIVLISFSLFAQSQLPSYSIGISDGKYISNDLFEFDIEIKSTDFNFVLTSYQCSFRINSSFSEIDSINFLYIYGSSELLNYPAYAIGTNKQDNTIELTFASFAGWDTISTKEINVGTFRIENLHLPDIVHPDIQWNFDGVTSTILTDHNYANITDSIFHFSNLTNLEVESEIMPGQFKLTQNYPNPFNPSTTIKFSLPKNSEIKLDVFNILGEKIRVLVDGQLDKGEYKINFDASGLASGIYFYVLNVDNNFHITKKMLLLR